jgi:hypothetical protein
MQLKYDKQIKNKVISIYLETINFSVDEIAAIDNLGDPIVNFNKNYDGGFVIVIAKKLRSGFKFTQKFDGTADLAKAILAAETFYDDIKEKLVLVMSELIDLQADRAYIEAAGLDDLTNF